MTHPPTPADRSRTPLAASFAFTFINSMGSCVVTSSGLYFITRQGYEFSDLQNSLLAVLLGVAYIVGAKAASRVPRWLGRLIPAISHRGVLATLMIAMALICALPLAAGLLTPAGEKPHAWPVWTVVLTYSPMTGVLWPIVESYLSGGRSGRDLRRTMGRWNVLWSSAGAVATLAIAPFVAAHPALVVALVGVTHLLALAVLSRFAREPAEHVEGEHEPHPPVYSRLLVTMRLLLPMGYAVSSAMGPYLPHAAKELAVPVTLQAMLATAWLAPRMAMFAVMQRWEGWHGRWFVPVAGGLGVVGGFAAALLASNLPRAAGLALLLAGLAVFGAAMSMIYAAAIYYAMEVGKAEVDAGGTHEALIGTGYTVGPAFGLGAAIAVQQGRLAEANRETVVLLSVLALSVLTAVVVVRRVARVSRDGP